MNRTNTCTMRKEKTFVMGIQNPANKEIIVLELFDLFF